MWEQTAPMAAWRVLMRRPWLCLIPLGWDLAKWGLSLLTHRAGLYFARWDFTVGPTLGDPGWRATLLLPPALPSVEQLGVVLSPQTPAALSPMNIGVMLTVLLADSLVKGGFLNLLLTGLQGGSPGFRAMGEGARRFGWRLFILAPIWMGFYSGAAALVERGVLPVFLLVPLSAVMVTLLAAAEFITVAYDVWPPVALVAGPLLLWQQLGPVLIVLLCSGLTSGLLTMGGSLLGTAGWLAPIYAVTGTFVAAAALRAVCTEDRADGGTFTPVAGEAG